MDTEAFIMLRLARVCVLGGGTASLLQNRPTEKTPDEK